MAINDNNNNQSYEFLLEQIFGASYGGGLSGLHGGYDPVIYAERMSKYLEDNGITFDELKDEEGNIPEGPNRDLAVDFLTTVASGLFGDPGPDSIPDWNEWYTANGPETTNTETTGIESITDEEATATFLAGVPAPLKGIITKDNFIKVLETAAGINDPMTAIKRGQVAGVSTEDLFGDWKNWKVFGPFIIPGLPLPPGIIDITIQDILDAGSNIGKTAEDFLEGIKDGSIWGELKDWAVEKASDPGGYGDDPLGNWENFILGTLGGIIGGSIVGDVYGTVKDIFTPDQTPTTPAVPGGTEEEDEPPVAGTGADPVEPPLKTTEDYDDPNLVDVSLLGGSDIVDNPLDPVLPGVDSYDTNDTNDTDDNTVVGGDDDDCTIIEKMYGGCGPSTPVDTSGQSSFDDFPGYAPPGTNTGGGGTNIGGGGGNDNEDNPDIPGGGGIDYDNEDNPDIPGGGGGGGGGGGVGGGGQGVSKPFLEAVPYDPTQPLALLRPPSGMLQGSQPPPQQQASQPQSMIMKLFGDYLG